MKTLKELKGKYPFAVKIYDNSYNIAGLGIFKQVRSRYGLKTYHYDICSNIWEETDVDFIISQIEWLIHKDDMTEEEIESIYLQVSELTDAELLNEYWSFEDTTGLWNNDPDKARIDEWQKAVCEEIEKRGI